MAALTTTEAAPALAVHGDTVEIQYAGPFELEFAERVVATLAAVRAQHPRVFILAASGGSLTPEARKYITEWLRSSPTPLETAVWGGGPIHRAIAEMIVRGARLFRPGRFVITFHRTRDDARAWIAAQRRKLAPT